MPRLPPQLGHQGFVPLLLSRDSIENLEVSAPSGIEKQQEPFPYPIIDRPLTSYALQSISLIVHVFRRPHS